MLVAFRLVQAAGAALLTPTSLGLVLASYPAERRGGAVRAWTATGGMAAALGPVVGGLLVTASWRWVFLVNVPIGLAALVFGWRRLPDVPGHRGPRPDAIAALLVTAGVAGLTLGLVKGGNWGWDSVTTVAVLAVSAAVIGLFRVRAFSGASVVTLLFSVSFGAMLLSVVLWMQDDWGWSALRSGLAIAPGPIMVPVMSFLVTGRLIARFGPGAVTALGSAAFAVGVYWWVLSVRLVPDYANLVGGMLLTGIGVGLTLPTLMSTAAASLPAHSFATGSGVVNMLRQVGFAIGVAVLIAVLGTPNTATGRLTAFRHGWVVIAVVALAGAVSAVLLRRPRPVVAAVPLTAEG